MGEHFVGDERMSILSRSKVSERAGLYHLFPEEAYAYDQILEAVEAGVLGNGHVDRNSAELLLAVLIALGWRSDMRALAGALPHFPEQFGLVELRSTLANLGYSSRMREVPGSALLRLNEPALAVDRGGEIWFVPGRTDPEQQLSSPRDVGWRSAVPRLSENYNRHSPSGLPSDIKIA